MQDDDFTYAVLHGSKEDGTDLHSLNMERTGIKHRNRVKNFFYGCILFGAGDAKTAKFLETTSEEAKKIKEKYFAEMPLLKAAIDRLRDEWRATARQVYNSRFNRYEYQDGQIRGLDGRPFTVKYEKDLLAYALQSDEAIQLAWGYVYIHEEMARRGHKLHEDWAMLIWMHDEYQAECKPEIADELGQVMCDAIRLGGEHFNIQCPHDGEYKIGGSWYDCH
jgi:DNA polymerase I-like protein with 3'-5' exonuclease and polymerase domains